MHFSHLLAWWSTLFLESKLTTGICVAWLQLRDRCIFHHIPTNAQEFTTTSSDQQAQHQNPKAWEIWWAGECKSSEVDGITWRCSKSPPRHRAHKVYETEEDVANAVAMMDGTELNGNRLLGRWWRYVFRTNGWLLFKVIFCYFPTWKSTGESIGNMVEYVHGICSTFWGFRKSCRNGWVRQACQAASQCRNLKSSPKLW